MDIVGFSCLNCGFVTENAGSIDEPECNGCRSTISEILGEEIGQYNEFKVTYADMYNRDRRTTVVIGIDTFEDAYYAAKEKIPVDVIIERIVQL